jgi:UDP-N-acetylglucosamine 2-epimerase
MNKILVIISSNTDKKKFISIIKKMELNRKNKILLLGSNNNIQKALINENIDYKKIIDDKINQRIGNLDKKAISWIKVWPNNEMWNNKNFKQITVYDNVSLWWFTEVWFYLASFYNLYSIKEIIKNIEIIQHVIHTENPNSIIITDEKSLIGKVSILLGNHEKIPILCIRSKLFHSFKYYISKHIVPILVKNFKQIKSLLREFSENTSKTLIKEENGDLKNKNKILFITHPTYIQPSINYETNEKIEEDIILGPIIRELKKDKNNESILVDTDPFSTFRFRFLLEKNYKHIEGYLTKEIKQKTICKAKEFSKIWGELKRKKSFVDSLTYKNIPIFELLEDKFSELFNRKFIEAVKYIEMMKQVVKVEKPDIIVIVDEYGLYGRAAILASKMYNIPILAIQHGVFTTKELGYFHYHNEISTDPVISYKYCPIPDKTAVSGQYYKNILTNSGSYQTNNVIITGQPKYDVLYYANKIFDKKKIYDKLKVNYNKKVIVLATQPYPKNENELLLRSVFTELKKFPDIQLVVKLHPNEYDKSFHQMIANETGIDAIIVKGINLYELLYACDLMMTVDSTVAVEAMILNKPVIAVTLPGSSFVVPYAKYGVAVGVYKSENISSAVIKVLNDKQIRKKLQSNIKKFVYNHLYKIDGLASKRIVNIINNMIKTKHSEYT